ncbi:unnamed protein product [Cylicocyclus nassatus]|uniref:E2F/DP family winged-helix DNA-binding domain-containing protein n=1 Tax=Cylicocyclus nassatus TaxID=53992 RepID=A0AA36MCN0_CYLNA|nr:unnamed protein product [Cylicocyclus nassatus]
MSQWAALLEANKENIPFALGINPSKSTTEIGEVTTEGAVNVPKASRKSTPLSTMDEEESAGSSHVFVMPMSSAHEPHDDLDDNEDNEITSRKEKSLGLLCQRFLVAMNEETRSSLTSEVHLETVARKMSVEKRRIYDIVNVMEALDAMSKTNKSYYCWHGLEGLPKLMADLQKEAVEERLPERVLRVEQAMCSFTELSPGSRKSGMKDVVGTLIGDEGSLSQSPTDNLCQSVHGSEKRSRVDGRDRQGRNSLAQLCRRFLMVLLSNPKNTRRVSLDVASTVLIKDPDTEGFEPPSRSRCRRLYDIANVLVALGLIKKVHYLFGTKKIPLFVYCGPEPDENSKFDVNACIERLSATTCSTPSTPLMKMTASTHQSTSLGKRSSSEANIRSSVSQKLPRLKSEDFVAQASSSLMMFAELAAERLRQETEFRLGNRQSAEMNASSMAKTSYSGAESNRGYALPRPQAQRSYGNFSTSPMDSPLANANKYAMKFGNNYQMPTMPMRGLQQMTLPTTPVWTPVPMPNFMRIPPEMARSSCPLIPRPVRKVPVEQNEVPGKLSSVKHTVTNILGVSNKVNIDPLNHRNSSPFQVVKKPQKQPFGSLHNIPNSH